MIHKGAKELFPCPTCGKSFSRKHFLTLHENSVHKKGDEHVRRCDLCDYETAYKPMLVQHSFTKHNVICNLSTSLGIRSCQSFPDIDPLTQTLPTYVCTYAQRRNVSQCHTISILNDQTLFQIMMPGAKLLTCDICGVFKTPLLKLLNRHKKRKRECNRGGNGDAAFPCEECGKTFRYGRKRAI